MFCLFCNQDAGSGTFCAKCGRPLTAFSSPGAPQPISTQNFPSEHSQNIYTTDGKSGFPTYLKVLSWIVCGLEIIGILSLWSSGYSVPVFVMGTTSILLVIGAMTRFNTWCLPLTIVLLSDSFGGIFSPYDPSQATLVGNIIATLLLGFMATKMWQITKYKTT